MNLIPYIFIFEYRWISASTREVSPWAAPTNLPRHQQIRLRSEGHLQEGPCCWWSGWCSWGMVLAGKEDKWQNRTDLPYQKIVKKITYRNYYKRHKIVYVWNKLAYIIERDERSNKDLSSRPKRVDYMNL